MQYLVSKLTKMMAAQIFPVIISFMQATIVLSTLLYYLRQWHFMALHLIICYVALLYLFQKVIKEMWRTVIIFVELCLARFLLNCLITLYYFVMAIACHRQNCSLVSKPKVQQTCVQWYWKNHLHITLIIKVRFFVIFWTRRNAFDRIRYFKLFRLLIDHQLPAPIIRILINL